MRSQSRPPHLFIAYWHGVNTFKASIPDTISSSFLTYIFIALCQHAYAVFTKSKSGIVTDQPYVWFYMMDALDKLDGRKILAAPISLNFASQQRVVHFKQGASKIQKL